VEVIKKKVETAVLVGLIHQHQEATNVDEFLAELSFLAATAGAKPIKLFVQRLMRPDSKFFLGSGKIKEIKEYISLNKVDLLIFDL